MIYFLLGMLCAWLSEGVALVFIFLREKLWEKRDKWKKAKDESFTCKFAPQGSSALEVYKEHPEYFSYTEDDK